MSMPHYEMFRLPPSATGLDPEAPPLPLWLKLGFLAVVSLITVVAATLA
jgi:hypothetical protein